MAADVDLEALGLLNGLSGSAREDRRELIEWLLGHGFDADRVRGALSPILLAANRVLGDDGTLRSPREVAESAGVSVQLLQQLHRAIGLAGDENPETALHSRADAESVLPAVLLADLGLDAQQVVLAVRLLSEGCRKAAMTMRRGALQAVLRPGSSELELAQAIEALLRDAQPIFNSLASELFRLALRQFFETEAINAAERAAGVMPGARPVGVAFADLVGFTRLGEALPPVELVAVASRLGDLARGVVERPVQFVKLIGDAVMLVSPDPRALLTTVFNLVDVAEATGLPRLRVGIAFGSAVSRAGDWYGSPVNVASRVTSAAPPAAIVVEESARAVIGDAVGVEFTPVRRRHLKGIAGQVRLYRVHRVAPRPDGGTPAPVPGLPRDSPGQDDGRK